MIELGDERHFPQGANGRPRRPARRHACLALAMAALSSHGGADAQAGIAASGGWAPARIVAEGGSGGDGSALIEQAPESASTLRRLLGTAHQARDASRVRALLVRLADMGYALSAASLQALSVHLPAEESARLGQRFEANRAEQRASRLVDSVPAERRLIEGIAIDPRRGRLFASSVVGRELLVREAGAWRRVEGLDSGSLFGMSVDPRRRLLWVASGAVEQTPAAGTAFRGLIALDLDRLRVVRRIPCAGGCSPADLTIGRDGTVYASDPTSGTVYRAAPRDRALSVLIPPGRLRSPQGLALSPDGRRLYVADYAFGIGLVDLADAQLTRLAAAVPAMLDGIDGLIAFRDGLIAIQNGTNPRRILRLRLAGDGRRISRVEVLERAHSEWGEPTLGAIVGDELVYVADAQWERYGGGGTPAGEGQARPTAIRSLPLAAGSGQ